MGEMTIRRFRPKGGEPRPRCTLCGKVYAGRRTTITTTYLPNGTTPEPYRGNAMLICESVEHDMKRRRDDAPQGNHWEPGYWADAHYETVTRVTRETWDGSWWGGYEPFCTYGCALAFARAAYRDGARYVLAKKEG
jgi:hypothetical protein